MSSNCNVQHNYSPNSLPIEFDSLDSLDWHPTHCRTLADEFIRLPDIYDYKVVLYTGENKQEERLFYLVTMDANQIIDVMPVSYDKKVDGLEVNKRQITFKIHKDYSIELITKAENAGSFKTEKYIINKDGYFD